MKNELPEIQLEKHASLSVQVLRLNELSFMLSHAEDHDPFAPHRIKFFLILLLTKDTYTHFVDLKSHELKAGSALFVGANQVHHFHPSLKAAEGFAIVFSHRFIDKHYFLTDNFRLNRLFNYHVESPVIHQDKLRDEDLSGLFAELYKEYSSKAKLENTEMLASLLRLLLLKAERSKGLDVFTNANTLWLETFARFKQILEVDYVKTRNSKEYASKLFVTYVFLNKVVREFAGKTVKTYIDDFVVVEIKRYLVCTSLSIYQVSFKTGFDEPANMINFFKRKTGITPLKFRKQR